MCHKCTPMPPYNETDKLCKMRDNYKPENCTGAPDCFEMMIMVNNEFKAYSVGCVVSTK